MAPIAHPGRLLKRELTARKLSANRLSLNIGVPSGRITDILNGRRAITADTAVRLGRYFGNESVKHPQRPSAALHTQLTHMSVLRSVDP
jgi:addiction module HigA family antidote